MQTLSIFFSSRWLPLETLKYCLVHTQCKLIILDPERANRIEVATETITSEIGTKGFLVLDAQEGKGKWRNMKKWAEVMDAYKGDTGEILRRNPGILPEDNATIIFTSGTWVY